MFDTYGPFTLEAHGRGQIDDLYAQINLATPRLESGFGVYIVFAANEKGKTLPWYVGRTYGSFGKRLKQHLDSAKFSGLNETKPIQIFLIARAKGGIPTLSIDARGRDFAAVSRLEVLLVGTCLRLNRELLNKQLKRTHEPFYVAGYLDQGQEHVRDDAAKMLARLLEVS